MSSLRNTYDRVSLSDKTFVLRNLTTNGLITGVQDASIDGSVTPVKYYIQPLVNEIYELKAVAIVVSDGGNIGLKEYGSISGGLTNGIRFFVEINGTESLIGLGFKTNEDLIDLGPNRDRLAYANNRTLSYYEFNISRYAKNGIILNGGNSDKFGVIVQDDLSNLVSQRFGVKGSLRLRTV